MKGECTDRATRWVSEANGAADGATALEIRPLVRRCPGVALGDHVVDGFDDVGTVLRAFSVAHTTHHTPHTTQRKINQHHVHMQNAQTTPPPPPPRSVGLCDVALRTLNAKLLAPPNSHTSTCMPRCATPCRFDCACLSKSEPILIFVHALFTEPHFLHGTCPPRFANEPA